MNKNGVLNELLKGRTGSNMQGRFISQFQSSYCKSPLPSVFQPGSGNDKKILSADLSDLAGVCIVNRSLR